MTGGSDANQHRGHLTVSSRQSRPATDSPATEGGHRDASLAAIGRLVAVASVVFASAGCTGVQSGLDPAGAGAHRIAELFWWMAGGAVVVWAAVIWLAVSAIRGRASRHTERQARWYIIGGGALFPTVILAGLLAYGLGLMPELLAPAPPGSLRIEVTGEQYWWRIRYHPPGGGPAIELANEVRLPVGQPVAFELASPDVIHSFWIPALGGKMDMIPGRTTRLVLQPTRTGTFRGQCAEFCGTAHALMAFDVIVMEPDAFAAWLEEQRQPADTPTAPQAVAGRELFFAAGCAACHALDGTAAQGRIGPNLTHVGSRRSLAAGTLANDAAGLARWLAHTPAVKPGARMPHFAMLPAAERAALVAYLEALK